MPDKLPPGATLVSDNAGSQSMRLPPGATLLSSGSPQESDLSSALGSMARMYTGRPMATPQQEFDYQRGRAAGQISGTATAAAVPAAMTAGTWGPPTAKFVGTNPFYIAAAIHIARQLGV